MDSALLNRNRRNFIAIAVALLLVNLFGWDYPNSLTIFGNKFDSSGETIHTIAGLLFLYWGWEYWLSFRSQLEWWKSEWRKALLYQIRDHKDILCQINPKSVDAQKGPNNNLALAHGELIWTILTRDGLLRMSGTAVLLDQTEEPPSIKKFSQPFEIQYSMLRWDRFISTIQFMFKNPEALNLWMPLFIGLSAVLTDVLRLFGVVLLDTPTN